MAQYTRIKATALRLITKFGGAAQIRRYTSDPDPTQSWRPGTSTFEDTATVAATLNEKINLMDGTSIPTDAKIAYVPASGLPAGFVPTTRDSFRRGDQQWAITEVEVVDPSGTDPVVYLLTLAA